MKRRFEKLTEQAARVVQHWWLVLVAGIFCIAAGIGAALGINRICDRMAVQTMDENN